MKNSGYPQMLFLDLRPVNFPIVFVASHEIAEQITRVTKLNPESVPKSPTMQQNYRRLIGQHSIISEGVCIYLLVILLYLLFSFTYQAQSCFYRYLLNCQNTITVCFFTADILPRAQHGNHFASASILASHPNIFLRSYPRYWRRLPPS